jgi:hypothetical protein
MELASGALRRIIRLNKQITPIRVEEYERNETII